MTSWKRIGASLLCIALVDPAAAQPGGKVMRIVVPFAAGGAREDHADMAKVVKAVGRIE
jgi:tripartite-type tricarboxylate transporter receptor subunit TctC